MRTLLDAKREIRAKQYERMKANKNVTLETAYVEHLIMSHDKKAIFVTSRVHPCECQASFSLEGAVDFLLSQDERAVQMRQEFIIYVVPMLNIDGVMQGNQRTNLSGWDLNRRWAEPSPYLCPAIWAAKNLARIVQAEREIVTYCDMHGHFQSYGSFIYGNSYDKGSGVEPPDFAESAMLRIMP